jgi:hypothetical protein
MAYIYYKHKRVGLGTTQPVSLTAPTITYPKLEPKYDFNSLPTQSIHILHWHPSQSVHTVNSRTVLLNRCVKSESFCHIHMVDSHSSRKYKPLALTVNKGLSYIYGTTRTTIMYVCIHLCRNLNTPTPIVTYLVRKEVGGLERPWQRSIPDPWLRRFNFQLLPDEDEEEVVFHVVRHWHTRLGYISSPPVLFYTGCLPYIRI